MIVPASGLHQDTSRVACGGSPQRLDKGLPAWHPAPSLSRLSRACLRGRVECKLDVIRACFATRTDAPAAAKCAAAALNQGLIEVLPEPDGELQR